MAHDKDLYRVFLEGRTGNALLFDLCRGLTHGKEIAVRIGSFPVQTGARQKLAFP
jgi:hypothetical protein